MSVFSFETKNLSRRERERRRGAAMADAVVSQVPAEGPEEAPLDAAAIRSVVCSRVEQLSLKWRRAWEEEEAPVAGAEAEARRGLSSMYEVADEAMDEWDSVSAAIPSGDLGDLDAYLEWLRTKVNVVEEMNQKAADEIAVLEETTTKDMIQLDVGIKELESSLKKLDPKDLSHYEASPINELPDSTDSCRSQSIVDNDYKFEVLKLDQQIEKSEMDLKLLQDMERADEIWKLESMLLPSGAKVLDFKDNCLRMFLRAPILTSDSLVYGHKMDCAVDSFVSDHELLIELGEGIIKLNEVQISPNDVCVDILIEMLKSSREMISSTTLGWLIKQIQHRIIVNALRRSLVNNANNSRHSFEYSDQEETIVAHLGPIQRI
ncbi:hypothetical protein QOZ80_4BG0352310 [Eleusine coracana subsp. coracana]|nr:hypothetical protein QOZ80_4BG0352310 [Eleusine coracana subsp. coracana]